MTTVSVVLTCYQQERYIEEALDSVAAQTWSDYELVVTDDASTDRSVALIRSWADEHDAVILPYLREQSWRLYT